MTDRQNPNEYTDEDSQPLRMLSYLVAPVGFLLEWGVARPLHYVATEYFPGASHQCRNTRAPVSGRPRSLRFRSTMSATSRRGPRVSPTTCETQSTEEDAGTFDRGGSADRSGAAPRVGTEGQPILH